MLSKIKAYCRDYINCPDMKILIVSPLALSEPFEESYFAPFFGGSDVVARSKELPKWYELVADQYGCYFLNATEKISAGSVDHLHLDEAGHQAMAELMRDKINEIFNED